MRARGCKRTQYFRRVLKTGTPLAPTAGPNNSAGRGITSHVLGPKNAARQADFSAAKPKRVSKNLTKREGMPMAALPSILYFYSRENFRLRALSKQLHGFRPPRRNADPLSLPFQLQRSLPLPRKRLCSSGSSPCSGLLQHLGLPAHALIR